MSFLVDEIAGAGSPGSVFLNECRVVSIDDELWVAFFVDAPRWLFESSEEKVDVQYYGPKSLTEFPNIAPFNSLSGLNFFHFIFDSSVDLTNEMKHGSVTSVGVEFKVFNYT